MSDLANKECVPCIGGAPPLAEDESADLSEHLHEDWSIVENHHLIRSWEFSDFASAISFTNKLGGICEEQNHHADFELGWGRVQAMIYTHKIDGLTESDFVLAAKFDAL